jgi:hypothetical protein
LGRRAVGGEFCGGIAFSGGFALREGGRVVLGEDVKGDAGGAVGDLLFAGA